MRLFVCLLEFNVSLSQYGHIETMPAREINPFTALTLKDSIPVFQDTMIDEQSQRVGTTTP